MNVCGIRKTKEKMKGAFHRANNAIKMRNILQGWPSNGGKGLEKSQKATGDEGGKVNWECEKMGTEDSKPKDAHDE